MGVLVNLHEPPLASAALGYAEQRLELLPCEPGGKVPLWGLGWEDASADPERVAAWWAREPRANIGMSCGGSRLALDVDGAEGEAFLAELEARHGRLPGTYEVVTGRTEGGRHLHFAVNGQRPERGWRYRGLELKANGYVLLPPSVHPDTGAWYYADRETELVLLPEWLARDPRPAPPLAGAVASADQDPVRLAGAAQAALRGELEKLAGHSPEPGNRRHTAVYAAAAAMGKHVEVGGIGEALVRSALREAGLRLGLADDADLQRQITNGLADGARTPYVLTERPRPGGYVVAAAASSRVDPIAARVVDLTELVARDPEPPPYRCHGLAADGYLTTVAGPGGCGKTWLALMLAQAVHQGESAAGIPCTPGRSVLFDAEGGPRLTAARMRLLGMPAEALVYVDARGLKLPADAEAMARFVAEREARLVILDSYRRLTPGADEDSSTVASAVAGTLCNLGRETDAAVLLLHHKSIKPGSPMYRGSSALFDQSDLFFTYVRVKGDPERLRRRLRCEKNRLDTEGPDRWVSMGSGPGYFNVCEAAPGPAEGEEAPERPRDEVADRLAALLGEQPQTLADLARAVGRDPKDGTVRNALAELADRGVAARTDDGWRGVQVQTPKGDAPCTPGTEPQMELEERQP